MTAPEPPPPAALAEAVRQARWAEVRSLSSTLPRPLSPQVALIAARAARRAGDPEAAIALLRTAIPTAGELAAALRLEAAETLLAAGRDPWQYVARLTDRTAPAAHRQAASDLLQRSFRSLSVSALQAYQSRQLPVRLRRDLAAALAVRTADQAGAIRALRQRRTGPAAVEVASWLLGQQPLSPQAGLLAAEALLTGGLWREADTLLGTLPPFTDAVRAASVAYLRGRAAYRLGRFDEAARHYDVALGRAPDAAARFSAAVQRARVAEILGEWVAAADFWEFARLAAPAEPEGWDGRTRLLIALGRVGEARALLARAPQAVLKVAGPRAVAALLARGETAAASALLPRLPPREGQVQLLAVAADLAGGRRSAAEAKAADLLASPAAGAWREFVFDFFQESSATLPVALTATRDLRELAHTAVLAGRGAARDRLEAALRDDPAWEPLLVHGVTDPVGWKGPAADLVSVGLDAEAAALYPHRFPSASPAELAWSARSLATSGNGPAALSHGERLWDSLGRLPAELLPLSVVSLVLPAPLASRIEVAAHAEGVETAWLAAIVRQESRFAATARSAAGALGVAQIVPETAKRLGAEVDELWDGDRALALAARELARLSRSFDHRLPLAAAAYNAGDPVVETWLMLLDEPGDPLFVAGVPYRETLTYVLAVREGLALARHLQSTESAAETPTAIALLPAAAAIPQK